MPVNFNLDSIRTLDANKSYYLSNTTGQVKEVGLWQKFKCLIGIKSAQRKVANLVDAIRNSLLQEAGEKSNAALDENIREGINLKGNSIKGSVLQDLVQRFTVADENSRIQNKAKLVIDNTARSATTNLLATDPEIGDREALNMIFSHAMKAGLKGELPKRMELNGPLYLDKRGLINSRLNPIEKKVCALLKEIVGNKSLGLNRIDKSYAKHVIDTLFNEDGTRNEKSIDSLKNPLQIRTENAFAIGMNLTNNRPQIVYDLLQKENNINPSDKIKMFLDLCEGDKDLEDVVMDVAPSLCMNSNNKLRSDETIRKKIAALKDNLNELRSLGYNTSDGIPKIFKIALVNLEGVAFPKGMLTRIQAQVKNTSLKPFNNLNSFSSADEIYEAVEATRDMMNRVVKKVNVVKSFMDGGEDEVGAPHSNATQIMSMAMLLSRLDPTTINIMSKAFTSTEASKMLGIADKLIDDLKLENNTVYTDPKQRDCLKKILEADIEMHERCLETLSYCTGEDLRCNSDPDADVNEGPAVDIRWFLEDLWEGQKDTYVMEPDAKL